MNKVIIVLVVVSAVILGVILLKGGSGVQTLNDPLKPAPASQQKSEVDAGMDTDKDGVPNVAELAQGTDASNADTDGDGVTDLQDKDPVFSPNPLQDTGNQDGVKIVEVLVENNVDPITKKDVSDHLEIVVKNTSGKDLSMLEIYYSIVDGQSSKKESYYRKLTDFALKANETRSIHFDSSHGGGHYQENPNSIYRATSAAKVFDVVVSAPGYKVASAQVNKDAGGAELAD